MLLPQAKAAGIHLSATLSETLNYEISRLDTEK
nr:hypothetical protein [Mixta sp. Marseille-Q2659]